MQTQRLSDKQVRRKRAPNLVQDNIASIGLREYLDHVPSTGRGHNLCTAPGINFSQEGSLQKVCSLKLLASFSFNIPDRLMNSGKMAIRSRDQIVRLLVLARRGRLSSPWVKLTT